MAGRWGEVRELGGAIIFLASDAASFVRELFDELPLGRRASPVEVADHKRANARGSWRAHPAPILGPVMVSDGRD